MRVTTLAALGAAALLAVPADAAPLGSPGPFAGQVRQGQTKIHTYDNDPLDQPCPQIVTYYRVALSFVPASDTLTLRAGAFAVTASGGGAAVTVSGSPCTEFDIAVTGTAVADTATYVVTVTKDSGLGGAS